MNLTTIVAPLLRLKSMVRRQLRPLRLRWLRHRQLRSAGPLAAYVRRSEQISGWARGDEALALARKAHCLAPDSVIVEIGSFLGSSAVLLAGARTVAGSGVVHCVDPFDGSGDEHSVPVYREISGDLPTTLREQFDRNIRDAGLSDRVVVHQATAEQLASTWQGEIDLLFLDGDQSPAGARRAFDAWVPHVRVGGFLAVHNSADRIYAPDHDGHRQMVVSRVHPPEFTDIECIGSTTFARKAR